MEGADITIVYKPEEKADAEDTVELIKSKTKGSRKTKAFALDLRKEENCKRLIDMHLQEHDGLDIL